MESFPCGLSHLYWPALPWYSSFALARVICSRFPGKKISIHVPSLTFFRDYLSWELSIRIEGLCIFLIDKNQDLGFVQKWYSEEFENC